MSVTDRYEDTEPTAYGAGGILKAGPNTHDLVVFDLDTKEPLSRVVEVDMRCQPNRVVCELTDENGRAVPADVGGGYRHEVLTGRFEIRKRKSVPA